MSRLTYCVELSEADDNRQVKIGGIITAVRKFYTKKQKQMAFVKLEDLTGNVEVVVFPDLFEKQSSLLEEDNLVVIDGRTDIKEEEEAKIIAEAINPLSNEQKYYRIIIGDNHDRQILNTLKDTLVAENGEVPVCLFFEKDKKMIILGEEYWVRDDQTCRQRLENLLGQGAVIELTDGEVVSIIRKNDLH